MLSHVATGVLGEGGALTVPVGNVLVGNAGGNIEHDDTALAVDVVTVTETTELLLTGGIPDIELNLTEVLREGVVGSALGRRASARATTRLYNRGGHRDLRC